MFYSGFPPLEKSDHVAVLVSIDFLSNSKWDAPFQCIAYDCSYADWDALHDHLREAPWEDIFNLVASATASEFCELIRIDVYIPHHKYQVKSHLFSWFLGACAAAIVHRNKFLHL